VTNARLHKEIEVFSDWISPTTQEAEVRAFVVQRVKSTIEKAFPQCVALPFGSFSTGLYTPDAYLGLLTWLKIAISIWWWIGRDIHGVTLQCENSAGTWRKLELEETFNTYSAPKYPLYKF
jgi:hypothetical protein